MESVILSMIEVVQESLGDARGIFVGLAFVIVSILGVLAGRRLTSDFFGAQVPEDALRPSGQPEGSAADRADGRTDNGDVVTPARRARAYDVKAGKIGALRWTFRGLGLTGIALVGSLIALDRYGTEPILRWSLAKLESRSGIAVTYYKAKGGLLSGELVLSQVHVVRENHSESNFDLNCSRVTVGCSLWKLVSLPLSVNRVRIEEVTGKFHRTGKSATNPQPENNAQSAGSRIAKSTRIDRLEVVDATIDFADSTIEGGPVEMALAIKSLECAPVRSAQAPFDLIFRSNVSGTIDGCSFVVKSSRVADGTTTEWSATALPIGLVRAYLDGPFRWLRSGECDVGIVQQMPDDQTAAVTLETRLVLRNIRPGVPDDTRPAVAIAAQILISQLKNLPTEKEISFKLKLDPRRFDLTKTEDREQLWKNVKAATIAGLLQSTPVNVEGLSDETNEQLDRAVDNATNRALKAIENIRARRQARKAARGRPVPPPAPQPAPAPQE